MATLADRALLWLEQKGILSPAGGQLFTTTSHSQSRARGTRELLKSYETSPGLRRVTSKIAYSVASTPWVLYKYSGKPGGKAVKHAALQYGGLEARQKLLKEYKQAGQIIEIESHPILDLLNRPNSFMTGLTARKLTQLYIDIPGECFWLINRNGAGRPSEIWVVPPHWVNKIPNLASEKESNLYYEVTIGSSRRKFWHEDIVWMKDINLENPHGRGTGIGQALSDEIETDEYAAKFLKTWFVNRAKPELMISIEGAKQDRLTEAKERFEREHRGWWHGHRSFWHSGKMVVKELTQKFSDMELTQLRRAQRDIENQTFGVPPEVMGIVDNSNRATIEAAEVIYAKMVIVPRLEFLRAELQHTIVPMFDDRAILGYVSPVPDDKYFQLDVMKAAPYNIERGEWRKRAGYVDRGDADHVHHMPVNLIETPAPKKATKALKSQIKTLTEEQIDRLLKELNPDRLTNQTLAVQKTYLEKWGNATLTELGIDASFDMLNPLTVEYLEQAFIENGIKGQINETTYKQLRAQLIEGVQAGEGAEVLAKRVRSVFEAADKYRSLVIARTEANRAANAAKYQAFKQSGVVEKKQWIATPDDRTRPSHISLDGQIQNIDDPFEYGGSTAMHPGDFGQASLDVHCRCTTVAVIEDPKSLSERQAIWKVYDRELIPWETALQAAFQRGFKAQLADILAVL